MMDISGGSASMSPTASCSSRSNPTRADVLEANCGPVIRRGLEHAIWELEYLVKERGARLCKMYQPEDAGPINDRRLWLSTPGPRSSAWPLTVHTGNSYVVAPAGFALRGAQLDDVMLAFPDLRVIAYHAGWPDTEALIGLCGKHVNLYMGLRGSSAGTSGRPIAVYHAIGTAMQWMPADKIVLGLDLPFDDTRRVVDYIRDLEMPEDCRRTGVTAQPTREDKARYSASTSRGSPASIR